MTLDDWEAYARAIGGSLAGLGLFTVLVGGLWLATGGGRLAGQVTLGGLVGGLVGALFLLVAADTLPPGERPEGGGDED